MSENIEVDYSQLRLEIGKDAAKAGIYQLGRHDEGIERESKSKLGKRQFFFLTLGIIPFTILLYFFRSPEILNFSISTLMLFYITWLGIEGNKAFDSKTALLATWGIGVLFLGTRLVLRMLTKSG